MRTGAALLSLLGLLAMSGATIADSLTVPASADAVAGPARGMTMTNVEARFGAPSQRIAPIGQPPISRWEYPEFVVFFEHEHVIHSVTR